MNQEFLKHLNKCIDSADRKRYFFPVKIKKWLADFPKLFLGYIEKQMFVNESPK